MTISFLDLARQNPEIEWDTSAALARVYRSGQYILGPEVDAFKKNGPAFVKRRSCRGSLRH
jgi:dTDP-4-amino-4,6-dideoxygalactose transaminase